MLFASLRFIHFTLFCHLFIGFHGILHLFFSMLIVIQFYFILTFKNVYISFSLVGFSLKTCTFRTLFKLIMLHFLPPFFFFPWEDLFLPPPLHLLVSLS